ncbi:hypothetical protein ZTR_00187 [Talaromyces verruculosus]|nr:hypothetical protein ZTR_00187 [Talaromyces verruculosus]
MATLTNRPSLGLARVATSSRPITRHRCMTVSATARDSEAPVSGGDQTNWHTAKSLPLSRLNLRDLFRNRIPDVRGSYNDNVFPPIGSVGITQFDHQNVDQAKELQNRFRNEANIDVVARVKDTLERVIGLPVRIAREGEREYFAGLLRLINRSALLHADFGPYDGPEWEIGEVTAQITWNILLKQVDGGDSVVYDRLWRGAKDDAKFKIPQSYGYSPNVVEGNFHEVKPLSNTATESRYTMSSFVGLLPNFWPGHPGLIMWS